MAAPERSSRRRRRPTARAACGRLPPGRPCRKATEAVEAAIRVLEDDPTFNPGHGSDLNDAGEVEICAAGSAPCPWACATRPPSAATARGELSFMRPCSPAPCACMGPLRRMAPLCPGGVRAAGSDGCVRPAQKSQ
ncbi:isoaspartyl peptidase/L-asparaginase [Paracoccus sp. MC1862]|uniref:isoaspartyl peptidase/L-asparaginase n=1 Tax=Paracoccus sp. MC1862 TaxID=2760307 RepID=UPI00351C2EDA